MNRLTFIKLLIGVPALLTQLPKKKEHEWYRYEDKTPYPHWTDKYAQQDRLCKKFSGSFEITDEQIEEAGRTMKKLYGETIMERLQK